jgi:hypothetical protein
MAMREWLGRLVLSACLVVAGAGSFFATAELASFDINARVLGVAVLVGVVSVTSLIFLRLKTGVTFGKAGPVILALVGTAFGVFQFWFAQQYLPTRQPPALEVTSTLDPTGVNVNGLEAYKATVKLKNAGSTKVIALASAYTVGGSRIASNDTLPRPEDVLAPFLSTGIDPYAQRYSRHSRHLESQRIVQAAKLFAENRYFEPGEEFSRERVRRALGEESPARGCGQGSHDQREARRGATRLLATTAVDRSKDQGTPSNGALCDSAAIATPCWGGSCHDRCAEFGLS